MNFCLQDWTSVYKSNNYEESYNNLQTLAGLCHMQWTIHTRQPDKETKNLDILLQPYFHAVEETIYL